MTASIDITGQSFGRLVALRPAPTRRGHRFWSFRCDCGTEKQIRLSHVLKGTTLTCGRSCGNRTHGFSRTRVWLVWKAMKQRCRNPNVSSYHRYGGRGITYTDQWEDFEPFLKWALEAGYRDDLELDRIDNDGNYTPANCQFISHRENSRKTGSVATAVYRGVSAPVFELAERFGLEVGTVKTRLRRGWTIERALTPSLIPRK
jgi:hypothetical protein